MLVLPNNTHLYTKKKKKTTPTFWKKGVILDETISKKAGTLVSRSTFSLLSQNQPHLKCPYIDTCASSPLSTPSQLTKKSLPFFSSHINSSSLHLFLDSPPLNISWVSLVFVITWRCQSLYNIYSKYWTMSISWLDWLSFTWVCSIQPTSMIIQKALAWCVCNLLRPHPSQHM